MWENNKSCKEATSYLLKCSLWQPEKIAALGVTNNEQDQPSPRCECAVCECPLKPRVAELCCG